ncbi:diguanylate cyclase domain-containing protein [Paenibacillus validus]|uniref:Diguanylate cyclase n=1 Tax=Paenibacillus validus TaxID=44253 RepID=A0A7X3CVK3_9BACL|nr:diguanylate cyclase [Paenibacillus validus]MUG73886.1 diguanylate cyclase [Paenibacillus validus]
MFKDFIANASILVASFFIIGQWFKERPLHVDSPWPTKVFAGICFGLLGVLLMIFSIHVESDVIADLRHIPMVIAALQGGPIPAIIAGVFILCGRIGLFGASFAAFTSGGMMLLISVVCGFLAGRKGLTLLRFFGLNVFAMTGISIIILINLNQAGNLSKAPLVLTNQWLVSTGVGLLSVYIFLNIIRSHASIRKLQESEERYRHLIASSPDATLAISGRNIVFINDKGLKLLHAASPKDILNRPIVDFIHPSLLEKAYRDWQSIKAGTLKSDLIEQRFLRLDGTTVEVELSVSPIVYQEEGAYLITIRDITARKNTEKKLQDALGKLQKLSDLDGLTGIPNRRKLDEYLLQAWNEGAAGESTLAFFLFDVDYFKYYNDHYGHLGGDEVLRVIAAVASGLLHEHGHFVARYGGEEFAAVLKNVSLQEAFHLAEEFRSRIERLALPHAQSKIAEHVTVSVGLTAIVPDTAGTPEQLVEYADKALYRAKAEGRNRVAVSFPDSDRES